jgi:predicted RNase H-related nuclease YkuK (DUF458 family)
MVNSPTLGKISLEEMIKEIISFIEENPKDKFTLSVGTDSHANINDHNEDIEFITAIVIYRHGKGARYFWKKNKHKRIFSLRDKIYKETLFSLELAQEIIPKLRKKLKDTQYDLEIHLDVGSGGETKQLIKEVVGIVAGNGFTPKIKPDAYAASNVADKYV